jgi:antitoxin (DNA-binding transcriptional repressor) of toxin-antitoxin stability system
VEEAAAGEEIIIAKAGKPVARLVPLEKPAFHRAYGALKGRIHAPDDFNEPLAITFEHATALRQLPQHDNDPFDRMLVAQAQCEGLTLVTADPKISAYDVPIPDALK